MLSAKGDPLNEYFFGRRGALFIAAIFSFSTVIGAAYVQSWCVLSTASTGRHPNESYRQQLLVLRILLGIGIGVRYPDYFSRLKDLTNAL